jgi:mitochondrial fission protein ELM1
MLKHDITPSSWSEGGSGSRHQGGIAPEYAAAATAERLFPTGLAFVPLILALFLAAAGAISLIGGTHFTVPHSGNIPGLHTNYWVPPIAAALGYLVLQCLVKLVGPAKRSWRQIAAFAVTDYLLLAVFILVIYVHFNIKMWVPLINPSLHDSAYYAVDEALRPLLNAMVSVRQAIATVLPAPDIWYQAAFFAVFVLSFLTHALGRRRFHYHNMVGLLLIEMAGPLTYLIAPAVGPFIFEHGPNTLATVAEGRMFEVYQHVRAGGADWIAANGGSFFAEPLAAMPSLHVGATLIIAYYAVRARLWMAPLAVAALFWITIESVVSRWHYLVDVPAGVLLAIAVIAITNRLCRNVADGDVGSGGSRRRKRNEPYVYRDDALAADGRPPLVWVLRCHRAGDHAQSLALAESLGWPFIVKKTVFHWYEIFFALAGAATVAGLNRRRSSPLEAPWPDLVILAGRQNETPAKWIRKMSGGRTRVVVIGRHWTPPQQLDCVVTTPQFRLPAHPHMLFNSFPLHRATRSRLDLAASAAQHTVDGLSGPYVALIVGGSSGPYIFSRRVARRLGREASALARKLGASLLVTTSARTGRRATRALEVSIDVPYRLYQYRPHDSGNPYQAWLGVADAVIVTADSMSMLAEACTTGRPVYMFEFGNGPAAMRGPRGTDPNRPAWWRWEEIRDQLLGLPYALAILLPPVRINRSRDIRLVQDRFIASGRVRWLADERPVSSTAMLPFDDLERATQRVRALVLSDLTGTRASATEGQARPVALEARLPA